MSALRSFRDGRLRRVRSIAVVTVLVLTALLWIGSAQAVHDTGVFELDGNVVHNAATTPPYDWTNLFGATGNQLVTPDPVNGPLLASVFVDDTDAIDTTYFAGGTKIDDPIHNMACGGPAANDKTSLDFVYAANVHVPVGAPDDAGHDVLYLGLEKQAAGNGGDNAFGFWLFKDNTVGCSGSGSFSGAHTDGDLFIDGLFANGGGASNIEVFRWNGNDITGSLGSTPVATGNVCGVVATNDQQCAIANDGTIASGPWRSSPTMAKNTFVEAGIDLTTLLGAQGGCFSTFLVDSQSSQSTSSQPKDYAGGTLDTCVTPPIHTTATPGGSTVPLGDANQFDVATISAAGGHPAPTGTMTFFLCSPSQVTSGGCVSGGNQVGNPVQISSGSASSDKASGSLLATVGKYCWRSEYNPDAVGSKFYNAGSHTDNSDECFTVVKNSPTIVTTPDPKSVTLGTSSVTLKDSAVLSGGSSPTGTITFTLVYNGSTVDTETVSVSGNSTYATPTGYTLPTSGTVTGTYQWNATYSGDGNNNTVSENNDASEQVTVNKAAPSLVTTASPHGTVTLDSSGSPKLTDSALLSGGYNPTGTMTFTLKYNGSTVYTDHVTVGSGNGTYTTAAGDNPGGYTLPSSGTVTGSYVWTASYGGDGNNNTASDPGTSALEQVTVNPASPDVVTTADPNGTVTLGDGGSPILNDSAVLSGGYHPTGTITFTLTYNGTTVYTDNVTVNSGNGTYTTAAGDAPGGYTLPTSSMVTGSYVWTATYKGDGNNDTASDPGTSVLEQVTVNPASPTIVTTPDPTSVKLSGSTTTLNDSAVLSGGYHPTGTITFTLVYNGVTVDTENAIVSGNGTYSTPTGYTLPSSGKVTGTYQWNATYHGDGNNNAVSENDDASERVTVNPAEPAITTVPSESAGSVNDLLNDTATLSDGQQFDGSGTITFNLYGPGAPTCGGTPAYTETVKADHNGDYTTSNTTILADTAGIWNWTGTFSGDGNNTQALSGCGEEEVAIDAPLIHIHKTADMPQVNAGDDIGFRMTVWNSGSGDAKGVSLTDPLPQNAGTSWSVDAAGAGFGSGADCSIAPVAGVPTLTCGPETVPAGTDELTSTFWVHITSHTDKATGGPCDQTGGLVDNTGHVSTTNDGTDDSSAEICVALPVIHIEKTADASQVNAGDDIGFRMTVWNTGNGDAKGVTLADPLPQNPGTSWSVDAAGAGFAGGADCSIAPVAGVPTLTCGPETVPAGGTSSDKSTSTFWVHITSHTTKATSGDCEETGLVDNTGSVMTSNDGSDQSSATICVAPADVSITKTADHSAPVHAGDPVGFTVEIKNTGTGKATGVILSDSLPAGSGSGVTGKIDTTVGSPPQFALSGAKGSQKLSLVSSTLPAGADYKVHVTAQTSQTECGTYDNTATLATGNANSPNPVSASESCVFRVDLAITKSGSPATQVLGTGNITWTMVVTNNGPDTDPNVKVSDPMPAGNTYVSSSATQGSCTGGAILNCDLGLMTAGQQVTITLVTTPSATGTQTNTAVVSGDRPEANLTNNTATATVEITAPFTPPPCVAVSRITPGHLIVGRKTTLTVHLKQGAKAAAGFRVRIKGAGINVVTKRSNAKGVVKRVVKMKKKGVLLFTPLGGPTGNCGGKRIGVRGVFTPPVTG